MRALAAAPVIGVNNALADAAATLNTSDTDPVLPVLRAQLNSLYNAINRWARC
jgi:hypothetical protein